MISNPCSGTASFRIGFHAVRVNDQFRIVFRFEGADAFDVAGAATITE